MTHLPLPTSLPRALRTLAAATLFALASAVHAALPPFASFSAIGNVSDYTNPGVWENHLVDVTALIDGASNAQLSFGFANDLPGTGSTSTNSPTNAHLWFAAQDGSYYLNFEYFFVPATDTEPFGNSSAHLRDVRLTIDGTSFVDQFGAFNNHLGDPLQGTAIDGDGSGINAFGQTGFEGRTYVLTTAVPEPETYALMLGGLALLGWRRKGPRRD